MASENYWLRQHRLGRRRLLRNSGIAGAGLVTLGLAGCGDDDDDGDATPATSSPTSSSSASPSPTGGAGEPKRGGTLRRTSQGFPNTMDPYATQDSPNKGLTNQVYSNLWQVKGVPLGPDFPSQEVLPDLAESTEFVDEVTISVSLNGRAMWQPPIGRPVVAEDIKYSFDRFFGNVDGATTALVASQLDMLESVDTPDEQTVVFTLKAPNVLFQWRCADNYTMPIMPPETGTAFDPAQTMVGSGPFILDSINAPTSWTLVRNPDWHLGPDRPYVDGIEVTNVTDPATAWIQFKAGNVDTGSPVPSTLREAIDEVPGVQISAQLNPFFTFIAFSAADPASPWNTDPRVRQAVSMAIDRDGLFEALFSPSEVSDAGLEPPPVVWHGAVPAGLGPAWVDPKSDALDANVRRFFEYDPEGARTLLEEAGYADGIDVEYHYATIYGPQHTLQAELVQQMLTQAGINATIFIDDNSSVYQPRTFRGDFAGFAHILQGFSNPLDYYLAMYDPASTRNQSRVNDQFVVDETAALLSDFDAESRNSRSLELQKYLMEQLYYVPTQLYAGPSYLARQPYLKGTDDHRTARSSGAFNQDTNAWIDDEA